MHRRPENGDDLTEAIPEKTCLDVVQHQGVDDMRLRQQCGANTTRLFVKGSRITQKSSRHQVCPMSWLIRPGSRIKEPADTKPSDQPFSTCLRV